MSYNFINFNVFDKIFVLVSGGIDSTYLYEHFKKRYIPSLNFAKKLGLIDKHNKIISLQKLYK